MAEFGCQTPPSARSPKCAHRRGDTADDCGDTRVRLAPLPLYQELCERGYTRSYGGFKRFAHKHFAKPSEPLVKPEKPKAYDGGKFPGERVQINVKYVPKACLYGERLYQYTLVDEYSRWCYREIHAERSDYASSTFLKNVLKSAPFRIKEVQTDNGHEFTNAIFGQKREKASLIIKFGKMPCLYKRNYI
ncbi:MAG: DDE-type integrase/transposase/recombinase [Oscillospiraceae bacterium]|nr:DDE-type integrase/transposase/recombinase [Oscillospiraceae bacterium]